MHWTTLRRRLSSTLPPACGRDAIIEPSVRPILPIRRIAEHENRERPGHRTTRTQGRAPQGTRGRATRPADALHQVVATSFAQHRQLSLSKQESATKWRNLGENAAQKLHEVRPRVRYSLPGLDIGLRNLSRLPDRTAHHKGDATGKDLLDRANSLAGACMSRSSAPGAPASHFHLDRAGRSFGLSKVFASARHSPRVSNRSTRSQANSQSPRDRSRTAPANTHELQTCHHLIRNQRRLIHALRDESGCAASTSSAL
jgi:hypothetical protein